MPPPRRPTGLDCSSKGLICSNVKNIIKILCRDYDFSIVSQKGSHIKLAKTIDGEKISTIIPNHKELAPGTLKGALRLGKINDKEFFAKYR